MKRDGKGSDAIRIDSARGRVKLVTYAIDALRPRRKSIFTIFAHLGTGLSADRRCSEHKGEDDRA